MSDQILTRYGPLDIHVAAVVRRVLENVAAHPVISLSAAYRIPPAGVGSVDDHLGADVPAQRWAELMAELFGAGHQQLIHADLTVQAALIVWMQVGGSDSWRTVRSLLTMAGGFFTVEADDLSRSRDLLPASVDSAALEARDRALEDVLDAALILQRCATEVGAPLPWLTTSLNSCTDHTPGLTNRPNVNPAAAAHMHEPDAEEVAHHGLGHDHMVDNQ